MAWRMTTLMLLVLSIGCATTGTMLEPHQLHDQLPERIAEEIERRPIHLALPGDLQRVYYLARVDSAEGRVFVGYFLEWSGEFPDFGRKYPVSRAERWRQLRIPLFYTNWLYIPRTGGLQRRMFGPGDVEGIWVVYDLVYDLVGNRLGSLRSVAFEMPGHRAVTIPDSTSDWFIRDIVLEGAPFLQLASWNHMFRPPDKGISSQAFYAQPFPTPQWHRLKMNRRRAEIAKRGLSDSVPLP